MICVGGNTQRIVARKLLGKFWKIRAKIFRTPKNMPAPTPMLAGAFS